MRHWQNLNDLRGGGQGSGFRHGRGWWGRFAVEWSHFRPSSPSFSFRKSDSGNLHFHVGIGVAQWFFSITDVFGYSKCDREISVRFFGGNLWLRFWGDPNDSSRDHQLVIHVDDWIRGKAKFSEEITAPEKQVLIPMPEGSYPATAKITRLTWKRPRWITKTVLCADINVPGGIPFQGKGENSWDCGDDGLYGSHCPANTIEEGIGSVVASVLTSRRRHGQTSETKGRIVLARPEATASA